MMNRKVPFEGENEKISKTNKENESADRFDILNQPNEVYGYGKRHIQAVILFIIIGVSTALRSSMTISILAMTDKSETKNQVVYNWDKKIIGFVMSSSFWGDVAVQGIAGSIANKYGSKRVLTIAIAITGVLMMMTPWFASVAGWKGVCFCTSLQGACQGFIAPCTHTLIGKWAPVSERTRYAMFVYSGMYAALILTPPIAAWICTSSLGWTWSYYIFGSQSFTGGLLWYYFGATSPANHKSISVKERLYIEKDLDQPRIVNLNTPWKSIFTSVPFLSLVVAQCGCIWGFTVIYTETPTYFKMALGMDLENSGLLTSLAYLMALLSSITVSLIADYTLNHNYLSLTSIRKLSNTIGSWTPALCMILVTYVPAEYLSVSIGIFVIMVGFDAINSCGFMINHVDLSPNNAGVLVGVASFFSDIFSLIAPITTGYFVQDMKDVTQWRNVYKLSAGMYFFGNLVFMIFGSGNVQKWDKSNNNEDDADGEKAIPLNDLTEDKNSQAKSNT